MDETRPLFDTKFTFHTSQNESLRVEWKRQPRFVRSSDNRKVKRRRRRGFPHWHALWTRRRRSVTQESRSSLLSTLTRSPLGIGSFSFRPGKNCGIICGLLAGFVGLISHFSCEGSSYLLSSGISFGMSQPFCPFPSVWAAAGWL